MKIKGVPHEYHVIDGVKESVIDIMLNFKRLRFAFDEKAESTQRISQRFSGIGAYTSKNLKLPA
jgi:DNA-directed RNA polymerase alpha subunit